MGKVMSEISMSLDGFITGPNVAVGNGMGDDGDRLHDWKFDTRTETDTAIVDELYASTGAVLIGGPYRDRDVGALVLPRGTAGITEASTTRNPSTPRTRSSGSQTASSVPPMAQVLVG